MKKNYGVFWVLTIVLFAGLSYAIYSLHVKSLSFVGISINPHIDLAVNDKDVVLEVLTINDDADLILSGLNLVGSRVDNASEKIMTAAMETGYIDEYSDTNDVYVLVTNDNESIRASLENKVVSTLNKHFEKEKINATLKVNDLDNELKNEAQAYGISNNKMLLIERAVMVNPSLSKAELATKSVKEIQQEIRAYVKARYDKRTETQAELKAKWQQAKKKAKEAYQNRVELFRQELLENNGIDTTNMTLEEIRQTTNDLLKAREETIRQNIKMKREQKRNSE